MSKICSEAFWMKEPCRNINRMSFAKGFSLATKGTACSTQSRSFFFLVEQLGSCGFSGSFLASKEKRDWEFRAFLQTIACFNLSTKQIHRNIYLDKKSLFPKTGMISFQFTKYLFGFLHVGKSAMKFLCILISCKAVPQDQQQASVPSVSEGPSNAGKDNLFSSSLSFRKHRKCLC